MKIIRKFLKSIILFSLFITALPTKADDADVFTWMITPLLSLGNLFQPIQVPEFTNFTTGSTPLDLSKPGVWVSTSNNSVQAGKAIKFSWSVTGAEINPRKYKVLYRIDPRFIRPQVFIKTYNYQSAQYEAIGFPDFVTNNPASKSLANIAFPKMQNYVDYFNFAGNRSKIQVAQGDVINITLVDSTNFFSSVASSAVLASELDTSELAFPAIYTESITDNQINNKIIYLSAQSFCQGINTSLCSGTGTNTKFKGSDNFLLVGKPTIPNLSLPSCALTSTDRNLSTPCFYDQGRGMKIVINDKVIKDTPDSFVNWNTPTTNSFLYYKSDAAGDLDFITDWDIQGMFSTLDKPTMASWITSYTNVNKLNSYINNPPVDLSASFLHFGRYTMIVEVGNGDNVISTDKLKNIGVEYIITTDGNTPSNTTSGTAISQDCTEDANQSGNLWLRVINPNDDITGNIVVSYANYTGTTWFSDIVYNGAVHPITQQFQKTTTTLYTNLSQNPTLKRIAQAAVTLYIIIFGIMFLMGTLKLTASDVLIRLLKIIVIIMLMRQDSWDFFNKYLFNVFISGTDYLISNVIGITSSKSNLFGFIDPIFDKYTNGTIWKLLFIQLLQIHNGMAFVAMMTIYSILLYFRAVLEVIISYVIAFVAVSVLISLAPFFLILILFEQTKSIFDNWISSLFNYIIQPTILLVFFLLIDQIMSQQLLKVLTGADWGILVPIKIGLDLTNMDIPINFSFTLPFLPGLPFYSPDVQPVGSIRDLNSNGTFIVIFTSALLFYAYCLMSYGLVDYITTVAAQLTNVTPARQEGDFQKPANPTTSIMHDLHWAATPVKDAALYLPRLFKEKVIDQKYRAEGSRDDKPDHTGKIYSSRYDRDNNNQGSSGSSSSGSRGTTGGSRGNISED